MKPSTEATLERPSSSISGLSKEANELGVRARRPSTADAFDDAYHVPFSSNHCQDDPCCCALPAPHTSLSSSSRVESARDCPRPRPPSLVLPLPNTPLHYPCPQVAPSKDARQRDKAERKEGIRPSESSLEGSFSVGGSTEAEGEGGRPMFSEGQTLTTEEVRHRQRRRLCQLPPPETVSSSPSHSSA